MKKKIAVSLIIIAVAGLIFSFIFQIREHRCCSCYAGWKLEMGIITLLNDHKDVQCYSCDVVYNNPYLGCFPVYRIIPVEFITFSLLIGFLGLLNLPKNKKSKTNGGLSEEKPH